MRDAGGRASRTSGVASPRRADRTRSRGGSVAPGCAVTPHTRVAARPRPARHGERLPCTSEHGSTAGKPRHTRSYVVSRAFIMFYFFLQGWKESAAKRNYISGTTSGDSPGKPCCIPRARAKTECAPVPPKRGVWPRELGVYSVSLRVALRTAQSTVIQTRGCSGRPLTSRGMPPLPGFSGSFRTSFCTWDSGRRCLSRKRCHVSAVRICSNERCVCGQRWRATTKCRKSREATVGRHRSPVTTGRSDSQRRGWRSRLIAFGARLPFETWGDLRDSPLPLNFCFYFGKVASHRRYGITRNLQTPAFFFLTHVIWDPVKENLNAKGPCVRTHAHTYAHMQTHTSPDTHSDTQHTHAHTQGRTRGLLKIPPGDF